MATLNTPIIDVINTFDPNYQYSFSFSYSGNQAVSNRAIIIEQDLNKTIYDKTQDGLKLNHTIPANTLSPGKKYTIQIQVFDIDGNSSNLSDSTLFYCYSTPNFYFSDIQNGGTIAEANHTFRLVYRQSEKEDFQEGIIYLYNYEKTEIAKTNTLYSNDALSYEFHGLKNNNTYFIRSVGKTLHGFSLDTGYIKFNVAYSIIPANILFSAENNYKTGQLMLRTNIIDIGYEFLNDKFEITDKELHIPDNTLTYHIKIPNDFTIIARARRLTPGSFLWLSDENKNRILDVSLVYTDHKYLVKLVVYHPLSDTILYREIDNAVIETLEEYPIITDEGKLIRIVEKDLYSPENLIVFKIYRKGNYYDLNVFYGGESLCF